MQVKSRTFLEVMGGIALVFIFLLWTISAAQATGNNNNSGDDQQQDQHQGQGQHQGQDQTQSTNVNVQVGGGSDANGNAVPMATAAGGSLTFNQAARPDDITIRNTASANMPNLTSTAPCVVSGSLGVGAAGFNIGGGKTKIDPECNIRETARTFAGLGEVGLALVIACTSEVAKAALGDACGLTASNVYIRVNETVRYVERATGGDKATHDVSEEAVEACTEGTTRAFKSCVNTK